MGKWESGRGHTVSLSHFHKEFLCILRVNQYPPFLELNSPASHPDTGDWRSTIETTSVPNRVSEYAKAMPPDQETATGRANGVLIGLVLHIADVDIAQPRLQANLPRPAKR